MIQALHRGQADMHVLVLQHRDQRGYHRSIVQKPERCCCFSSHPTVRILQHKAGERTSGALISGESQRSRCSRSNTPVRALQEGEQRLDGRLANLPHNGSNILPPQGVIRPEGRQELVYGARIVKRLERRTRHVADLGIVQKRHEHIERLSIAQFSQGSERVASNCSILLRIRCNSEEWSDGTVIPKSSKIERDHATQAQIFGAILEDRDQYIAGTHIPDVAHCACDITAC